MELLNRATDLDRMASDAARAVVYDWIRSNQGGTADNLDRVEQWRREIPPLELWQAAESAVLEGFYQIAFSSQEKPAAQEDPGPRTADRRMRDCIIRSDSWPGRALRLKMEIEWGSDDNSAAEGDSSICLSQQDPEQGRNFHRQPVTSVNSSLDQVKGNGTVKFGAGTHHFGQQFSPLTDNCLERQVSHSNGNIDGQACFSPLQAETPNNNLDGQRDVGDAVDISRSLHLAPLNGDMPNIPKITVNGKDPDQSCILETLGSVGKHDLSPTFGGVKAGKDTNPCSKSS